MTYIFEAVQTFSVIIIFSYLLSRTSFLKTDLYHKKLSKPKLILVILVFLFISMYGIIVNYLLYVSMYVDTRVAGIALAGILFGYLVSVSVFIPTVILSYLLNFGSQTFAADIAIMVLACWLSGFCRNRFPKIDSVLSGIIVGALELTHMLFIVFLVRPLSAAKEIVYSISFPMIVLNGCATALFVLVMIDLNTRRILWQKEGSARSELEIANRIQTSLLPTNLDVNPALDLGAFLEPAKDVGGDLYNFFVMEGHLFKFILGDVSGKGVPAAITMSRATSLFRTAAANFDSPADMLEEMNRVLCENNKAQMFVTAVAGVFDLNNGHLVYSNAGHTQSYRVSSGKPVGLLEKTKGTPMGIMKKARYIESETTLKEGEYVFLYTDGISEAENNNKDQYGSEKLENCLSNAGFEDSNGLIKLIIDDVTSFIDGANQSDDIAVLAFGRRSMTVNYSINNDVMELLGLLKRLNSDLEDRMVDRGLKDDVCLVTEEVLTNIIKYGYNDERKDVVSVRAAVEERSIVVEINDRSDSFDQFGFDENTALNMPAEERKPGQMGVKLVKDRVADYSYTTADGVNTIRLVINGGERI